MDLDLKTHCFDTHSLYEKDFIHKCYCLKYIRTYGKKKINTDSINAKL